MVDSCVANAAHPSCVAMLIIFAIIQVFGEGLMSPRPWQEHFFLKRKEQIHKRNFMKLMIMLLLLVMVRHEGRSDMKPSSSRKQRPTSTAVVFL